MRRPNRDTASALVLLVACGAFFWASSRIRDMGFETLGAEVWPRIILALLTALSVIYLLRSLTRAPAAAPERSPGFVGWLEHYRNVIVCFALFGAFLLTLPYLGMLIGGIAFVFLTLTLLAPLTTRNLVVHALIAVLAVGAMWAVFTFGLNVILPEGRLLRLL